MCLYYFFFNLCFKKEEDWDQGFEDSLLRRVDKK